MKFGVTFPSSTDFSSVIEDVVRYENAGIDAVWLGESYGFDAVTALGAIAHATSRIQVGSGILPVYSRSAPLIAQTAAGLDAISGGRAALGLGTSGPAVIEGWHGRPYDDPIGTTREVVRVCRAAWAKERVESETLGIPYGDRRPLKLMSAPVRDRIPIHLAALGPRSVALTAEIADGWLAMMFWPERASGIWDRTLARGTDKRDPGLAPLQITAPAYLAIDDDGSHERAYRLHIAHYVAAMGPPGQNFYHRLMCDYGFQAEADRVQELYLGKQAEAAAQAVPDAFVAGTALIGTSEQVAARVTAYADAGVGMLNLTPAGETAEQRTHQIRRLLAIVD